MINLNKCKWVPDINIVACRFDLYNTSIILVLVYIPPSLTLNGYQNVIDVIGFCDVLGNFNTIHFNNFKVPNAQKCDTAYNFMQILSFHQHNLIENNNYHFWT